MNTVHLEPKSTGFLAEIAEFTNSLIVSPRLFANVSINEPQPEEQASFSIILSMELFFSLIYFMS